MVVFALCHPEEIRALTVREYCRIQEFPDEWIVCGTPAQQYAQIGKAVPLRLGKVAGNVIAKTLDRLKEHGWQTAPGASRPYRMVYIQAHVRTRQWYKNGKAFQWKDGKDNSELVYSFPKTQRSWTIMEE